MKGGRGEEEGEGEKNGERNGGSGRENEERSNCGRVLVWCNPHLLRGQRKGGRERDGSEILNYIFFSTNIGVDSPGTTGGSV
jgi:hypothetical protein